MVPITERISSDDSDDAACGFCAVIITIFSVLIIILTFPITIFFCIKIVQEYERAVIFRLGRIKKVFDNLNLKYLQLSKVDMFHFCKCSI